MNATAAKPTKEQIREAAIWMALLRAPERTEKVERGFQRWLEENERHRCAFETISNAWEETAALPKTPLPRSTHWQRTAFRQGYFQAAATIAAVVLIAIGAIFLYQRNAGVATDIGEQRQLTLKDGSRVTLNTATRVVVRYDGAQRAVELKGGEALFDVKTDPAHPFIVRTGDREIRALGTSFIVRRDEYGTAVTLVDGKVSIEELGEPSAKPTILSPGQRLTLAATKGKPAKLDEPAIEKVTAWRNGHVDLVDTPLADAAAEMNRYSITKIVIEQPETAAIHVTGIFRAGDTASFANAIAETYGLKARQGGDRIVITTEN